MSVCILISCAQSFTGRYQPVRLVPRRPRTLPTKILHTNSQACQPQSPPPRTLESEDRTYRDQDPPRDLAGSSAAVPSPRTYRVRIPSSQPHRLISLSPLPSRSSHPPGPLDSDYLSHRVQDPPQDRAGSTAAGPPQESRPTTQSPT